MEKTMRKYARFYGFNEWEDFVASIETEEELQIHKDIAMYQSYKPMANIPLLKKKGKAYEVTDRLTGLRIYRNLVRCGEDIFCTTERWLRKGTCDFKYIFFDEDQWHGTDSLELIEWRSDGRKYTKELKLI